MHLFWVNHTPNQIWLEFHYHMDYYLVNLESETLVTSAYAFYNWNPFTNQMQIENHPTRHTSTR